MTGQPLDAATLEIIRNYFRAIVEDICHVVERTAFTTLSTRPRISVRGPYLWPRSHVAYPWNLGATPFLGINDAERIDAIPQYDEGDIVTMNDPCTTDSLSTHLPDVHVLKSRFFADRPIAYAYAFVHSSDVGGTVPASIFPKATELYQEGMRIRPTRLYRAGYQGA